MIMEGRRVTTPLLIRLLTSDFRLLPSKYPFKNLIDIAKLMLEIKERVEFCRRQALDDLRIMQHQVAEISAVVPDPHGHRLHDGIGVFTGDAFGRKLQQQAAARRHTAQ